MSTRYLITHAGPSLYDCDCHERSRVTDSDGVARLSITDTVTASSLQRARQGVDPRCAVALATAQPERVAA